MPAHFDWPVRVYYEDTDAGGVVYHTAYLCYLERARTEWLRSRGYAQARLARELSVLFSVVDLTVRYAKPARLDDALTVRTAVVDWAGASVRFDQSILSDGGEVLLEAHVRVACVDSQSFKPCRWPEQLKRELQ